MDFQEFKDSLKDIFEDGFYSIETYNDVTLNSSAEAWENYAKQNEKELLSLFNRTQNLKSSNS